MPGGVEVSVTEVNDGSDWGLSGVGMIGTTNACHGVFSAPFCCPKRPSAPAIRRGRVRVKSRHPGADTATRAPRPPAEGTHGAGDLRTSEAIGGCFPAQGVRPRRFGWAFAGRVRPSRL